MLDEATGDDRGYAFYHSQDAESAASGQGLYLAYGLVNHSEDPADTERIGHEIAEAVRRNGLQVTWDGSVKTRIHVPLTWQRRWTAPAP
ncbi:DUF6891 domain-containing protein [Fodinicola feengrottensis]|uniref:DUF6891 domain-containing protein n=1 Tax=Fodinicola feengrottensis TaxID=435914 RepID=UPI0036F293C9